MPATSSRDSQPLRVLMVAPQPFFRARGTPFSVLHRIRALCSAGHFVDLITYPFGQNISLDGLKIIRADGIAGVRDVKIGPSVAKLLLDLPLYRATAKALERNRYDVIHSHEEAAFFSMHLAKRHNILHVYDMHSSLPQQLKNFKAYDFGIARRVFEALERKVLTTADGVITICQALADVARVHCGDTPHAMIQNTGDDRGVFSNSGLDIRFEHNLQDRYIALYTGTLEPYQGIDILLTGFAKLHSTRSNTHLLIVGGRGEQITHYRQSCRALGIADAVTFVGTVPPSDIPSYLKAADVIVSPRSKGTNTPLKIYGYMRSGKPLLATRMPTHTQTLDELTALLVPPTADAIEIGMARLMDDPALGVRLAEHAMHRAEAEFSDAAYIEQVLAFYGQVTKHVYGTSEVPEAAAA